MTILVIIFFVTTLSSSSSLLQCYFSFSFVNWDLNETDAKNKSLEIANKGEGKNDYRFIFKNAYHSMKFQTDSLSHESSSAKQKRSLKRAIPYMAIIKQKLLLKFRRG